MKNNMNIDTQNIKKTLICKKKAINLFKIQKDNESTMYFQIECNITNNNITIRNIVNFKLFELLAELNKDIIEKNIILNYNSDEYIESTILFNKFSDELGLEKHFVCTKTTKNEFDDKTVFQSTPSTIPDNLINSNEYKSFKDSSSTLQFNYISNNSMNLCYSFAMDLDVELPTYMENMIGLIMKKTIFRLKSFIENI